MNNHLYSEINSTLYKKLPQDLIKNVCDMMKKPRPKYKSGQAIYLRNGNIFVMNDFLEFIIAKDSEEILMLVYLNTDINVFFNTIINKKTKEYTETYTSIEDAKEYENTGLVYGTCEILK